MNKSLIFKKILIFLNVFGFFLILDLLSKHFVFDGNKTGEVGRTLLDIKVIAFRSQFHDSTTFLDFFHWTLPRAASLSINFIIILVFFIILAFSKSKLQTVFLSIALAGIVGNTTDTIFYQGVRNIMFIPWHDNGTFNIADCLIVVGVILFAINTLISLFLGSKNKKPQ